MVFERRRFRVDYSEYHVFVLWGVFLLGFLYTKCLKKRNELCGDDIRPSIRHLISGTKTVCRIFMTYRLVLFSRKTRVSWKSA